MVLGAVSLVHTTHFGARFFFVGLPGWCLIIGAAILLIGQVRWLTAAPAIFLAYLAGGSIYRTAFTQPAGAEHYRPLAASLAQDIGPRDTVILDGTSQWLQYWYYADLRAGVRQRAEIMPRDASGNGADGTPVDVQQTARALETLAPQTTGFWFIDTDSLRYDPKLDTERLLALNWAQAATKQFGGQRLLYFSTARPASLVEHHVALGAFSMEGYSPVQGRLTPGQTLTVDLALRDETQPVPDFRESLRLVSESGAIAAQQDNVPQGGFLAAANWQPGGTLLDHIGLIVPKTTPPGDYTAQIVIYDAKTVQPLGPTIELGKVTVSAE
jgi:hypothetical protein